MKVANGVVLASVLMLAACGVDEPHLSQWGADRPDFDEWLAKLPRTASGAYPDGLWDLVNEHKQ